MKMKKRALALGLGLALALCGCVGNDNAAVGNGADTAAEGTGAEEGLGGGAGAEEGLGGGAGADEGLGGGAGGGMNGPANEQEPDAGQWKNEGNGSGKTAPESGRAAGNDSGASDSEVPDSGTPDSGTPDSGTPDSEVPDSGTYDSEAPDGGASDSGAEGRDSEGRPGEEGSGTRAVQGGPYGEISVTLPDGWKYEAFPMDSEALISGDYGIHFWPEGVAEGFIELAYIDFFGVCGTGLAQEDAVIAGSPVRIGTYDGHAYWDFVRFTEQNDGVVALTYQVEDWWEDYRDAVTGILDTLAFEGDKKEGGAYVFRQESEDREIGLYFSLKNISSAGATLVYNQFDPEAPTGELQDGDDFVIERYEDGNWGEVPVVVEGDYGFHDIAYTIPKEQVTERELSWEWLYGQLAPGEYRIRKSFQDFRKTADYDDHVIYAYFILTI